MGGGGRARATRSPQLPWAQPTAPPSRSHPGGGGHAGVQRRDQDPPGPAWGWGAGAEDPQLPHPAVGTLRLGLSTCAPPAPQEHLTVPVPTPRKHRGTPRKAGAWCAGKPPHSPEQGPQPSADGYLGKDSPEVSTRHCQQAQPHLPPADPSCPTQASAPSTPAPSSWCGPPPLSVPALALGVDTIIHSPCVFLPGTPAPGSPPHTSAGSSGQGSSPVDASSGLSPRPGGQAGSPPQAYCLLRPLPALPCSSPAPHHPQDLGDQPSPPATPHSGAHTGPGRRDFSRPRPGSFSSLHSQHPTPPWGPRLSLLQGSAGSAAKQKRRVLTLRRTGTRAALSAPAPTEAVEGPPLASDPQDPGAGGPQVLSRTRQPPPDRTGHPWHRGPGPGLEVLWTRNPWTSGLNAMSVCLPTYPPPAGSRPTLKVGTGGWGPQGPCEAWPGPQAGKRCPLGAQRPHAQAWACPGPSRRPHAAPSPPPPQGRNRFPGLAGSVPRHASPQPGPHHPRAQARGDSRGWHAASGTPLRAAALNTHTHLSGLDAAGRRRGLGTAGGANRALGHEGPPGGAQESCTQADGQELQPDSRDPTGPGTAARPQRPHEPRGAVRGRAWELHSCPPHISSPDAGMPTD